MGVRERRKTFFHEKKSFSPLPEPLSSFQKKRSIYKRELFSRQADICCYLPMSETEPFKNAFPLTTFCLSGSLQHSLKTPTALLPGRVAEDAFRVEDRFAAVFMHEAGNLFQTLHVIGQIVGIIGESILFVRGIAECFDTVFFSHR